MLSRFWAQWFKVWSVLSDTALWASTTSSYGIQVIHKRLSEMSYLLQIPPSCGSASPLLILPELHHLPSLCSSSDQSIIFAPIFVFFFRSLWFFLFFFLKFLRLYYAEPAWRTECATCELYEETSLAAEMSTIYQRAVRMIWKNLMLLFHCCFKLCCIISDIFS